MTAGWHPEALQTAETVELEVPADPAYLTVVRAAIGGLAARLDLTVDDIEDLRIAVDEACAIVLDGRAHPGQKLGASFTVGTGLLDVVVTGPATAAPTETSFAWAVLRALVGEVQTGSRPSGSWIRLIHAGGRGKQ